METEKHFNLLGMKGKDVVTGFKGVITSLSFDLYGCVQAVINPRKMDKEGKCHICRDLRFLALYLITPTCTI